jgi:hypothetical protein
MTQRSRRCHGLLLLVEPSADDRLALQVLPSANGYCCQCCVLLWKAGIACYEWPGLRTILV